MIRNHAHAGEVYELGMHCPCALVGGSELRILEFTMAEEEVLRSVSALGD